MMSDLVPADIISLMCIYSMGYDLPCSIMVPHRLSELGLIFKDIDSDTWCVTEGGKMLIDALCKTPIPIKKWSMP